MNKLALLGFFALSVIASSANTVHAQVQRGPVPAASAPAPCFEVSRDGTNWSRTPERLCVSRIGETNRYDLRLMSGNGAGTEIAVFHLELVERVRCSDCNRDRFGLSNPSNSSWNALEIRFNGQRDASGNESGTINIGATVLHYRKRGSGGLGATGLGSMGTAGS